MQNWPVGTVVLRSLCSWFLGILGVGFIWESSREWLWRRPKVEHPGGSYKLQTPKKKRSSSSEFRRNRIKGKKASEHPKASQFLFCIFYFTFKIKNPLLHQVSPQIEKSKLTRQQKLQFYFSLKIRKFLKVSIGFIICEKGNVNVGERRRWNSILKV